MPASKWTKESAKAVLANCHSRREAKQKPETNGAWQWAYKKGFLSEFTPHFERERVPRGTWQDIEKCREVLSRFNSPSKAKADNEGATAYRVARENGWVEELTSHWSRRKTLPSSSWSIDRCVEVLKQFPTLLDAKADNLGNKAISAARYLGCYESATTHMPRPDKVERGYWTKERCKSVLETLKSITEATATEKGRRAYNAAKGNGWTFELTGHFVPGEPGFNPRKPANTYFLRLTNGNNVIYKVGITNREVLQRVQSLIRRPGTIIEVQGFVAFDSGVNAKIMEEELLFSFSDLSLPETKAKEFIGNGFTECFSADLWHLSGLSETVDEVAVISGDDIGAWGLSSPSKIKWLRENAIEAAKACNGSRSILRRKHPSAYNVLRDAGILDEYCPVISQKGLSDEVLIAEIKKHSNATSLRAAPGGESLYIIARNRGLWNLASENMVPLVRREITDKDLMELAKSYDSQTSFRRENKAAYNLLYSRGLVEAACKHMSQRKTNWRNQKKKVLLAARECRTKSEFVSKYPGAVGAAKKEGYWQEATSHMDSLKQDETQEP